MQNFKQTVADFEAGDASVNALGVAMRDLLAQMPDQRDYVIATLTRLRQANTLTAEAYSRLLISITQQNPNSAPANPASPAADDADRTVFAVSRDDATIIVPRAQPPANAPEDEEDSTVFKPGSAPRSTMPDPSNTSPSIRGNTSPTTGGHQTTTGNSQFTWTGFSGEGTPAPDVGSVIKGRFTLEKIIGTGGMGLVFKAKDLRKEEAQDRNPWVAIKVLNDDFKSHPEALRALQREARKSQDLSHPNIITVFDFDRDGDNVFMTMELMDGEPLDKLIRKLAKNPIPLDEALRMTRDMGLALAYAHRAGIVHSDFKPGNVFLNKNNGIKVFDFGIARASKQGMGGAQGEVTKFDAGTLGALTPAYASLEMIRGEEPDARDDIYALACVAYELMTGRHPYAKKSAEVALHEKMVVAPVPGLSRRQMKGLLKGLAFDRVNRSESVDQFLDDIGKRELNKLAIGSGLAAAVLLVTAGAVGIPYYIEKNKINAIIETIRQGDEAKVSAAVDSILLLEKDSRKQVISDTDAQDGIIKFIETQVSKLFNPEQKRYDYPGARAMIKRGTDFYRDSATLSDLIETIEKSKNTLMLNLDTLYTQYLDAGKLLDDGTADSVPAVLAIAKQVDPASSLLSDKRLAVAYLAAAKQAVAQKDYATGEKFAAAGLQRYADDAALINIRDTIKAEQVRGAKAGRIAELAALIDKDAAALTATSDTKALAAAAKELRELDAEHAGLKRLQASVDTLADSALNQAEQARDWTGYDAVLARYKELAPVTWTNSKRDHLVEVKAQQQQQQESLLAAVVAAVGAGKFNGTGDDTAESALKQLKAAGADHRTQEQAITAIFQGYIKAARDDRGHAEWAKARQHIESGLALIAGHTVGEAALKKELAEIAQAEKQASNMLAAADRAKLEQERTAKIQAAQKEFEQVLVAATIDTVAADQALGKLDEIASLDPANTLVNEGNQKLAAKVAEYARSLGTQGRGAEGLKLVQDVAQHMPDSKVLLQAKISLDLSVKAATDQAIKQELAANRQKLDALLAKPDFTPEWEASVKNLAQMLGGTAQTQVQQLIARVYIKQVAVARDATHFAEAEGLLERGRVYSPDLPEWAAETAQLAEAQQRFEQASEQRAKVAKVDAFKQTILTQAKANDLRGARKSLAELTTLAPDDAFIRVEAPQVIVDSYLRLAETAAKSKQYDNAVKLVQAGLEVLPTHPQLQQDLKRYVGEQKKSDIVKVFKAPTPESIQTAERLLGELRTGLSAGDATTLLHDLALRAATNIKTLMTTDVAAAKMSLTEAKRIFGDDAALREIVLPKDVPAGATVQPDPAAAVPADGAAATVVLPSGVIQGPKSTATAASTANLSSNARAAKLAPVSAVARVQVQSPAACVVELAGYGSKGRGVCYDMISATDKGPSMVVLPSGGGFAKPFLISKYEISAADYKLYCSLSNQCKGDDGTSDGPGFPLVGLGASKAQAYAKWLSATTGVDYRLPTSNEWEYAANATGATAEKDFNCQVSVGGSLIRGNALVEVKTGKPNGWGLINYFGNAQELVQDGGSVAARGGAYTDSLGECTVTATRQTDGKADKITGFRLVRTLQ